MRIERKPFEGDTKFVREEGESYADFLAMIVTYVWTKPMGRTRDDVFTILEKLKNLKGREELKD